MMEKDQTTRWNNLRNRVEYLQKNEMLHARSDYGEGSVYAFALCEELDKFEKRIRKLEVKKEEPKVEKPKVEEKKK